MSRETVPFVLATSFVLFVTVSVEDVDGAGVCYVSAKDKEGEEPGVESEEDEGSGDGSTEEEESDDKEERDIIEMDETRKEDRLDCESILRYLVM